MGKKILTPILMLLFLMTAVMGANEITQDADRLNYWSSTSHVITVTNTDTLLSIGTISSPWTVTATSGNCTNVVDAVTCTLAEGETGTYTVTSDASVGEYATQSFEMAVDTAYTAETVTMVRVKDGEIFRTLVEYGRGRGNYFYDSGAINTKGIQCTDLPADTNIELNYLHKIYPIINNYLNVPSAEGSDLTLSCVYPNSTMTKQHLATSVVFDGDQLNVSYESDWIKNSWEKVLFLVQDFDEAENTVGDSMTVSCEEMEYYLADANGWIKVATDSFTFDFQNSTPITASATSNVGTIGTGTTEVEITYTITNTEDITLSSSTVPVSIDIRAPEEAEFIGVRGEMWGSATDVYRFELNSIEPNGIETITLVARFDTTGATPLDLSTGISVSFVPCWQVNAYNPLTTEQSVTVSGTIAVDGSSAEVTNLVDEVVEINAKVDILNTTLNSVQTTVESLEQYVIDINTSVTTIESYTDTLEAGQTTIMGYVDTLEAGQTTIMGYTDTLEASATTIIGYTDTLEAGQVNIQTAIEELNVTTQSISTVVGGISTVVDSNAVYLAEINTTTNNNYDFLTTQIVATLEELNVTTQDTNVIVRNINTTANAIEVIVTDIQGTVDTIETTVNTIDGKIDIIDVNVDTINTNTATTLGIVQYINETRWGNVSAQMIYDQLESLDTSAILTQITSLETDVRQLSEFEEEAIYLITDSITEGQKAYTEALSAIDNGDSEKAISELQKSIDLLTGAEKLILDAKLKAEGTSLDTTDITVINRILGWIKSIFG